MIKEMISSHRSDLSAAKTDNLQNLNMVGVALAAPIFLFYYNIVGSMDDRGA